MPNVLVKSLGYKSHRGGKSAKGIKSIKSHIKYIENRQNEEGEREKRQLFGKDGAMDRKEFFNILNNQPDKGVIAHKLVLSMERGNFENRKIDYKDLAKDIMSSYEAKTNRQYNWVACIHDKSSNPHIHLVVSGRDTYGKEVVFMPTQLNQIKKIAEKECDRHTERNLAREPEHELDFLKQIEHERTLEKDLFSKERKINISLGKAREWEREL